MQTLLILIGVAFGVGVMVFLTALIGGLQGSLIRQTLSAQAHVVVRPHEDQARPLIEQSPGLRAVYQEKANQRLESMDGWQPVQARIEQLPGVIASAATVAGSALVSKGNVSRSVALRGVQADSYQRVIAIGERIRQGQFRLVGSDIVIGVELAKDLGLGVGDKLRVASTTGTSEVFTVSGVFDLGNKDINQRWVFVSLRSAQTLLDLVGRVSTVEVRIGQVFEADSIAQQIADRTGLVAESWMKLNAQLLTALRSQSSSSYIIQFFVIVSVALGIASVLVVSVVQKSREIGILKATGTSTAQVLRVFLLQGALVGLWGSLLGCGLGAVLAQFFARLAKNPDGSPTFPVDLSPGLFLSAIAIATGVGVLSAAAPARRAAKLDPAMVIRYG